MIPVEYALLGKGEESGPKTVPSLDGTGFCTEDGYVPALGFRFSRGGNYWKQPWWNLKTVRTLSSSLSTS